MLDGVRGPGWGCAWGCVCSEALPGAWSHCACNSALRATGDMNGGIIIKSARIGAYAGMQLLVVLYVQCAYHREIVL